MNEDLLFALQELLEPELPGLAVDGTTMRVAVEARYGRVVLGFDFDPEAESIRMFIALPPPAGAGSDFLIFCLATNTLYWDVKLGLDAQGMLLLHADVDLDQRDLASTARVLVERAIAMRELLDDDLVGYLLEHRLATPAQLDRWSGWPAR